MATFLSLWAALAWLTNLSEVAQFFILSTAAVASVIVFYPWSRCLWTVLVYLSGGIERPPLRVLPGGQLKSELPASRPETGSRPRREHRLHRR
jgi:hypothetical protein